MFFKFASNHSYGDDDDTFYLHDDVSSHQPDAKYYTAFGITF